MILSVLWEEINFSCPFLVFFFLYFSTHSLIYFLFKFCFLKFCFYSCNKIMKSLFILKVDLEEPLLVLEILDQQNCKSRNVHE